MNAYPWTMVRNGKKYSFGRRGEQIHGQPIESDLMDYFLILLGIGRK